MEEHGPGGTLVECIRINIQIRTLTSCICCSIDLVLKDYLKGPDGHMVDRKVNCS